MERKTEQAAEFGRQAAEREIFFPDDVQSEYRAEFNAPETDVPQEQAGSDPAREILGQGEGAETVRRTDRKIRRRRNLLLQMAAAGMSVVVVTSAMGVDLLGSDALFGGEAPPMDDSQGIGGGDAGEDLSEPEPAIPVLPQEPEPPEEPAVVSDAWLRIYTSATEYQMLFENGETVYGEYNDYMPYDPGGNVLAFENDKTDAPISVYMVEAYHMGSDFTLYVDDPEGRGVTIGKLVTHGSEDSDNGSVTITGTAGGILYINSEPGGELGVQVDADGVTTSGAPDEIVPGENDIGLHISANGGESGLMVHKEVTVNIGGTQQALLVENSGYGAIEWENPYVFCSGKIQRTSRGSDSFANMAGMDSRFDWTVADENDVPARSVSFYRGETPALEGVEVPDRTTAENTERLSVTLQAGMEPIILADSNDDINVEIEGVSYDRETKTLTLTNVAIEKIEAERMGPDFTIYLQGENSVGQILTRANLSSTYSGDLRLSGDNGANLIVNPNRTYPVGILMAAGGSPSIFAMDWGIDVEMYGTEAAFLLADTHKDYDAIQLADSLMVSGAIAQGDYAGETNSYSTDWVITERYDSLTAAKETSIYSGRGG